MAVTLLQNIGDEEMLDKKIDPVNTSGKSTIRKNRKINSKDYQENNALNIINTEDGCLNEQEEDRMIKSNIAYLQSLRSCLYGAE